MEQTYGVRSLEEGPDYAQMGLGRGHARPFDKPEGVGDARCTMCLSISSGGGLRPLLLRFVWTTHGSPGSTRCNWQKRNKHEKQTDS